MTHRQTRQFCKLDDECQNQLKAAMTELGLSARAHDKVLRVARTIADLDRQRRHPPDRTSTRRSTTGCWTGICGRNMWTLDEATSCKRAKLRCRGLWTVVSPGVSWYNEQWGMSLGDFLRGGGSIN